MYRGAKIRDHAPTSQIYTVNKQKSNRSSQYKENRSSQSKEIKKKQIKTCIHDI